MRPFVAALSALAVLVSAAPVAARDSLGVFGQWGAFRDPKVPRCYAIAQPEKAGGTGTAYASVGTWPKRGVRGQLHVRLSRAVTKGGSVSLSLGGQRFALTGGGAD